MAGDQAYKIHKNTGKWLRALVVVLTLVVEGKIEKGGGGKAATVKSTSDANVSDTALGTVKTPPHAPPNFMKQVADMVAMLALSGGLAGMLVALKYYVVKAVKDFVESMTGLGYADDP